MLSSLCRVFALAGETFGGSFEVSSRDLFHFYLFILSPFLFTVTVHMWHVHVLQSHRFLLTLLSSQPHRKVPFFLRPFFFFPPSPPPSVLRCLCLIYPFLSDKVSGDQRHLLHALWRCIVLLNYAQGQGLVCIRRYWECMSNRWRETACTPSDK